MASLPLQTTTSRRRRALGSFVSGASTGGSYSATRDSAMSLNPRAEAFVPATSSKRKASSVHSTSSASAAPNTAYTQPVTSTISSQVLFGQSRVRESDWAALGNALRDGELGDDSTEDEGQLDLPVDVLRAHYLSLNENVQHLSPHSAMLVWLGMRKSGSKAARYLPLESNNAARGSSSDLRVQSNHAWCTNTDGPRPSTCKWPPSKVPVEIFELIATSLARDDVMAMRLVNHEFEDKVSRTLFHTCVVPFNTELYDMIDEDAKNSTRSIVARRLSEALTDSGRLQWLNAKEDAEGKVYRGHGLRVFQGFGTHIKRFGMSFEVDEYHLSYPPVKKSLDAVESYHGRYDWPPPHYARFANLAGLERTADETSKMKAAFSHLTSVKELALSIDNGLGWLNGPDHSIRARILKGQSPVFESSRRLPSQQSESTHGFWNALLQSHKSISSRDEDPRESVLEYRPLHVSPEEILGPSHYTKTGKWPSIDIDRVMPEGTLDCLTSDVKTFGVLYSSPGVRDGQFTFDPPVKPSELKKEQKEWLLEMDWAQRAFLESYMLAVVDNSAIFERVTTLNIAKLSSRFIKPLASASFWEALPALEDVTLLVSPDWRSVEKDEASIAETTSHSPSHAVDCFHDELLQPRISDHPTIKRIKIGWVGGGEHAEGMYARNNHVLPAPITQLDHSLAIDTRHCLQFQNVEHLTLTNCWISPPALEGLLQSHADKKLRKLTLDSVSLTAHPNVPAGAGAGGGAGGGVGVGVAAGMNAIPVPGPAIQRLMQNAMMPPPPPPPGPVPVQAGAPPGPINALHGINMPNLIVPAPHTAAQNQIQQAAWWVGNVAGFHGNQQPLGFPPLPPLPPQPSHFAIGHRSGSWPDIINRYSPGVALRDYLPQRESWEEPLPPRPSTHLHTLEFKSCGYALLNAPQHFDQTVIEPDWSQQHVLSPWFCHRATALKPLMMDAHDAHMGRLTQCLTQHEQNALQLAWGLTTGWQEHADDPTWDGLKPGGTGRFSGIVYEGMGTVSGDMVHNDGE